MEHFMPPIKERRWSSKMIFLTDTASGFWVWLYIDSFVLRELAWEHNLI